MKRVKSLIGALLVLVMLGSVVNIIMARKVVWRGRIADHRDS